MRHISEHISGGSGGTMASRVSGKVAPQKAEAKAAPAPAPPSERKKRTITEIRDSKASGEKMVYMSVPDYTSAKWAEIAGVDVAVVGDSLAIFAGTASNSSMKQPASSIASASSRIFIAASAVRP